MGKKINLKKIDKSYRVLYKMLSSRYGKDNAERIYKSAEGELAELYAAYSGLSKGEKNHTDKYIFPRIAVYKSMKAVLGKSSMELMDRLIEVEGEKVSRLMNSISKLPFMKGLILKIFRSMAKNQFGESGGFSQRFYDTPKNTVRFDILACPYCSYCRECGCPELIHTFCNSDGYCFGNLSKISFTRNETLECGKRCDFELKIE